MTVSTLVAHQMLRGIRWAILQTGFLQLARFSEKLLLEYFWKLEGTEELSHTGKLLLKSASFFSPIEQRFLIIISNEEHVEKELAQVYTVLFR